MRKANRNILLGVFLLLVVVLLFYLVFYLGFFQSVVGEGNSFVLDSRDCSSSSCYDNGVFQSKQSFYGHFDSTANCGQYLLSGSVDTSGCSVDGCGYVDIFLNNNKVVGAKNYHYQNLKGVWYDNVQIFEELTGVNYLKTKDFSFDVTKEVSGGLRNDVKIVASSSAGASFNNLVLTAYECEGDRFFTRSCPLFDNFTIKGLRFGEGYSVSLKDFPSDAYFCEANAVLVQDSSGRVVSRDSGLYLSVLNGESVVVPGGEKYLFLFVTKDTSSSLLQKDQMISDLLSDIGNLNVTVESLQLQKSDLDKLLVKYQGDISSQLVILEAMNNTIQENVIKINELNLKIEDQAKLINGLTQDSALKSYYIGQLQAENYNQKALLQAMNESFKNQGEILSKLNFTIEQDASYIASLKADNQQASDLIIGLKLNNEQLQNLYDALKSQNEVLARDNADLVVKNNALNDLISQVNAKNTKNTFLLYGIIGILIIIILLLSFFIFRRKKRRK